MQKAELLDWLQTAYQQWAALIAEIGPARMDQPGVNGDWSIKDLVAHLNGWQPRLIARIQAAQHGEAAPPPPWPATLQTDDEINAWIYTTNQGRSVAEVLAETQQHFQQLLTVIAGLPADVQIKPAYRVVQLNGQRFSASEFFDHFRDDHEPDVRAWLTRQSQP